MNKFKILVAAMMATASAQASATIVIFDSPGKIQPDENVLFKPDNNTGSMTAFGVTNQTNTSITFTSTEGLQTPPNGQARIENLEAFDGVINNLSFFATDPTLAFDEVEFNIFGGPGTTANSGTLTFTDQFGTAFTKAIDINNGQNFFSAQAIDGQVITKASFVFAGGLDAADVRQVRVGFTKVPAIPEPSTWAMMLLGFGSVGYAMRRRPTARFAQAI